MIAVLGGFVCCPLKYLRQGGLGSFVPPSPSSPCLFLINTHTLGLLLVDLGPPPLPRLK